jgi:hypothetical protein
MFASITCTVLLYSYWLVINSFLEILQSAWDSKFCSYHSVGSWVILFSIALTHEISASSYPQQCLLQHLLPLQRHHGHQSRYLWHQTILEVSYWPLATS